MKRAAAVLLCLCLVFCLSSCKKKKNDRFIFGNSSESVTYDSSSDKKYNDDYFKNESNSSQSFSEKTETKSQTASAEKPEKSYEKTNEDLSGWYFKHLTVKQKEIYKKIDAVAYNMKTGYFDLGKCEYSDVLLAFKSVVSDRPEYFWLSNNYMLKANKQKNGYLICLSGDGNVEYLCTHANKVVMETQMESAFLEIKKLCQKVSGDYNKELTVHDWLAKRITYDSEAAADYNGNRETDPLSFTSYGGLVERQNGKSVAVCEGYAKAFKYVLKRLNIESVLITGEFDGTGHMWNAVKIKNKWYNVDVTADDTEDNLSHAFFNATDKAIEKTHKKDRDFYKAGMSAIEKGEYNLFAPKCDTVTYNYFVKNGLVISSNSEAAEIISKRIIDKFSASSAEFCFADEGNTVYKSYNIMEIINQEKIIETVSKHTEKEFSFKAVGVENSKAFRIVW